MTKNDWKQIDILYQFAFSHSWGKPAMRRKHEECLKNIQHCCKSWCVIFHTMVIHFEGKETNVLSTSNPGRPRQSVFGTTKSQGFFFLGIRPKKIQSTGGSMKGYCLFNISHKDGPGWDKRVGRPGESAVDLSRETWQRFPLTEKKGFQEQGKSDGILRGKDVL